MIDILLATYNGEKYLRQQLDSIFTQTNQDWRILVRDDGSDDNTLSIIRDYMAKYPDKVALISDKKSRLGTCLNFGQLLEHTTAEYIMFSDQDDFWLPNKIELTLEIMQNAERLYPDKPLLVHTDLKVVDSDLNVIAESMWSYRKLDPWLLDNMNKTIVQPVVSGSTMMLNMKAKEVSIPIPKEALMHDWWIPICVAKHGKIVSISVPSVLWRQHLKNRIGTRETNSAYFFRRLFHAREHISTYCRMYKVLKETDYKIYPWSFVKNKFIITIVKFLRTI